MSCNFDMPNMADFEKDVVSFRRDLHSYPEAGWTEFRTTVKVIKELQKLGLKVQYGKDIHNKEYMYGLPNKAILESCEKRAIQETSTIDGSLEMIQKMSGGFTGCVAEIEGNKPGPVIAVRVDIDCNEVNETTGSEHIPIKENFVSKHEGLMHACGHDGHTSIGIGLAKMLVNNKDKFNGKVKIIFQPAEEGLRGAASITHSGILSDVDFLFGAHIGLKVFELGTVAASSFGFLSSTKLDFNFVGKPSHAGVSPELGHNAIAAASSAVLNLLAIARHGGGSSRINIGTIKGGTGRNVIPENASIAIETRGATSEINEYMQKSAERVCKAAADMYECSCESIFMGSAGSAECSPEMIEAVKESSKNVPEVKNVLESVNFGGGEDITHMMNEVLSHGGKVTEMVLGTPLKGPHHNSLFDFDEKVLLMSIKLFAEMCGVISNKK